MAPTKRIALAMDEQRHAAGHTVRSADLRVTLSVQPNLSSRFFFYLQRSSLCWFFPCVTLFIVYLTVGHERTQHAVLAEDPAAALGPVHADLRPVPAPLPHALRPRVRRPDDGRGPEPLGRLGVPPAVRGVSVLLFLLVVLLHFFFFFCRIQPGEKDFKSRKLPLHEPNEAQGANAAQQQQSGPEEQTDPVPRRPDQHHERPL